MDFIITAKNKRKAQKRRIRKEEKWKGLRRFMWLSALVAILVPVIVIYDESLMMNFGVPMIGSVALVLSPCTYALLINLTSHWIQDRMNERLMIKNGVLYLCYQTNAGLGLNYGTTDSTGYTFAYTIDTIRNAKYDEKSGRIEFRSFGTGFYYSDIRRQIIGNQWPLENKVAVFYDYYEPSLIDTLKAHGVQVEVTTLDEYIAIE